MKSFLFSSFIYLNKKKFQWTLWEYEKQKVNVTQRSPWNSIYVSFSHEKMIQNFSYHALCSSVSEGRIILLIFFGPLSCGMWKCSLLF